MGLFRKWGFGAELIFEGGRATAEMGHAQRAVIALRGSFGKLSEAGSKLSTGLSMIGTLLAPIGIGFGLAASKASSLAGNLEAQKLTMRVLVGDLGEANKLLQMIHDHAMESPFTEGQLIEGSKRLLRLTGDNLGANMDLLKTMETMAALNPTKTLEDAVEGLLDATSGGGFERLKEFGFSLRAEDFAAAGRPGGKAWADAVISTIQKEINAKTRGEDLTGALSRTLLGRLSSLQDAVENAGIGIGGILNETLGPAVIFLTDLIKNNTDDMVEGFRSLMTGVRSAWESHGQPLFDQILGAWEQLGSEGRARLFKVVLGLGMLITVLTPLFGVLAIVGIAIGGMIAILSGAVTVIGALGSVLVAAGTFLAGIVPALGAAATALGLPVWVVAGGIITAVMAAVAAAVAVVGGAFTVLAQRSAFVTNELPFVLEAAWAGVQQRLEQVRAFVIGLALGFSEGLGPVITEVLADLQPPFDALVKAAMDLIAEFGTVNTTTGDWATAGRDLGGVLAGAVAGGIRMAAFGVRVLIEALRLLMPLFEMGIRNANRLSAVFFGLADGSLSTKDAIGLMLLTMQQNLLTTLRVVVGTMLTTLELVLKFIAERVSKLPGLGGLFGAGLASLSGGVSEIAGEVDRRLDSAIAGIDQQAADIERNRVLAASFIGPVQPPVEVTVKNENKMCIDGKEVARSVGEQTVRAGERGTGPALPAQQRGRVLRHGGAVTPLSPAEAF